MANHVVSRPRGGSLIHVRVAMLSSFLSAAFFFKKKAAKSITYYAWSNRGEGTMKVWLPRR